MRSDDGSQGELQSAAELVRDALLAGKNLKEAKEKGEAISGIVASIESDIRLNAGNINQKILNALESLSEGEVTSGVNIGRGFQIFRVDKINVHNLPYKEVVDAIKYKLRKEFQEKEYQRLVSLARSL